MHSNDHNELDTNVYDLIYILTTKRISPTVKNRSKFFVATINNIYNEVKP